jgi:carbamoyltransferase
MAVLGISAFYHDSAVALVDSGHIVGAAQEERFSRRKHDASFPTKALGWALKLARERGLTVDTVAWYEKPLRKFERLLKTWFSVAPRGLEAFRIALPGWSREKLWVPLVLERALEASGHPGNPRLVFFEHHESHAASAFLPSPFERAAILTVDGVGEWATSTLGRGEGSEVSILLEQRFPHSLGLLYSAFTYYLGFKVNSGEYKLMGLAPYGEPRFVDLILDRLVDLREDGSFRLDTRALGYLDELVMTREPFHALFGGPPRQPESEISAHHADVARSIQAVTEEILLRMARHAARVTGEKRLCLAGGVALNCVANGRILREGPFEDLWIQPAAGDAGGALGAALLAAHRVGAHPRRLRPGRDAMRGALLGPSYDTEIEPFLERTGHPARRLSRETWAPEIARLLAEGAVIGFFQGPMEYGPRALGARSILADPRSPQMQRRVNLDVKRRESFRPFAPACLEERASEVFDLDRPSPYMLLVARVKDASLEASADGGILERLRGVRSSLPAITHVDLSARVQTVGPEDNPRFHELLRAFEALTGCPVLLNTSFNVRGEPIVCTPADAWACFLRTEMEYLVLGDYLLDRRSLPAWDPRASWSRGAFGGMP